MKPKTNILDNTFVSITDQAHAAILPDLQGNILKHHGRTHAWHIFLKFNSEQIVDAKTWIVQFAIHEVTNSQKQLDDAAKKDADTTFDGGTFKNISLSASGYKKLGIPASQMPADIAFLAGLKNRTTVTNDNLHNWEEAFAGEIDAIIIVADRSISVSVKEKNALLSAVAPFANVVHLQKGKVLKNQHGIGIEHFGYADGISQPDFLKPADKNANQWDDGGALLNTLLVKEPELDNSFGSYFVFRKLEQNVLRFKTEEKSLPIVKEGVDGSNIGTDNGELAGAMIIGRFEDGTEVINHSSEQKIVDEKLLSNDFDYRDDNAISSSKGSKCPFHAHIRVTNPRGDVGDFAKTVRLTRRGIPFNDIGRDEFDLDNDQPEDGVGLLFMCYQSSIVNQFEFIQQRWANQGDIGGHMVGQDAIIGQGANGTNKFLPVQWGIDPLSPIVPQKVPSTFRDFVTMRGGEYFFTPSIGFLKNL